MCPHRGLVQFTNANLTQVSCPGPPRANKSPGQDIPGICKLGQCITAGGGAFTLPLHQGWFPDLAVCDKLVAVAGPKGVLLKTTLHPFETKQ